MEYQLKNEFIAVKIKRKGAELASLKPLSGQNTDLEYIWQAEAATWARHAPILFPIVGKLKKNAYLLDGNPYYLPQHGFARDIDFELVAQSDHAVTLNLASNEASKVNYPFDFELFVTHSLNQNQVEITWQVVNKSEQERLLFSIGAHPGFNILVRAGEQFEDYKVVFKEPQRFPLYYLQDGLIAGVKSRNYLNRTTTIGLTANLFDEDALVFPEVKATEVSLENAAGDYKITVGLEGFPYFGLWSKPGKPFVCLEPWLGVADSITTNQEFDKKLGIISLSAGQTFEKQYFIRIDH